MTDRVALSVIVSAFNEAASIAACVEQLSQSLPPNSEILIVDGGNDETAAIARRLASQYPTLRYIHNENDRGKGHAVRVGIAQSRAPLIVLFDADLQFFATDLPRVIAPLQRGEADVVLGSRFLDRAAANTQASGLRHLGNRSFSLYASLLYGQRFTDVLAGTKAFTREAAKTIDLQSDTFEYEVEIVARARHRGLRIVEVSVDTRLRDEGDSKVSIFKVGLKILAAMTRFRFER